MLKLPSTSVLRLEHRGFYLTATIDDRPTRNAMTAALVDDLEALLAATENDRSLRALVLKGSDGLFCAGADLKNPTSTVAADAEHTKKGAAWSANRRGGCLFARMNRQPMAVIVVVDGPAFGGGFGLTCCADIVICTQRARFALSEATLGLLPAQIAPYVVARLGLAKTRRLALTATRFGGAEALLLGLADYSVQDANEADTVLETLLASIRRCAPQANAATKQLLLDVGTMAADVYADRAADAFAAALSGPEAQEGLRAFAEKRLVVWAETP